MVDLNAFVPPGSDLTLNEAVFINDRGEISGFGTLPNGDFHAFLLIPCGRDDTQGCQDDVVGASVAAPVSRMRVTHSQEAGIQRGRMLIGPANRMPGLFGKHLMPWYHGSGVQRPK